MRFCVQLYTILFSSFTIMSSASSSSAAPGVQPARAAAPERWVTVNGITYKHADYYCCPCCRKPSNHHQPCPECMNNAINNKHCDACGARWSSPQFIRRRADGNADVCMLCDPAAFAQRPSREFKCSHVYGRKEEDRWERVDVFQARRRLNLAANPITPEAISCTACKKSELRGSYKCPLCSRLFCHYCACQSPVDWLCSDKGCWLKDAKGACVSVSH